MSLGLSLCLCLLASACTQAPRSLQASLSDTASTNQAFRPGPARQAGVIGNAALTEISGMAVSQRDPDVLWVLNDSGNPATLYALSHSGRTLGEFPVNARNRDWEDLASVNWNGEPWLLIADIGDNQARHEHSFIHLLREPALAAGSQTLTPALTLRFTYEDGPRDAESLAATGDALLVLSKPPASQDGDQASTVYSLPRPPAELLEEPRPPENIIDATARRIGSLGLPPMNLEAKLIAALSGVDVRQPTGFDINARDDTAYVLSYRTLRRYRRQSGQSWAEALQAPGRQVLTHSLRQAEALAAGGDERVWFTSESVSPNLWVWQGPTSPAIVNEAPALTRRSMNRQNLPM